MSTFNRHTIDSSVASNCKYRHAAGDCELLAGIDEVLWKNMFPFVVAHLQQFETKEVPVS